MIRTDESFSLRARATNATGWRQLERRRSTWLVLVRSATSNHRQQGGCNRPTSDNE